MDVTHPCRPNTEHVPSNISVRLQTRTCPDPSVNCQQAHPNIQSYVASIELDLQTIGHVKAHVFDKQVMDAKNSPGMWEECHRCDQNHFGAKLDKIDNYLDNESFKSDAEVKVQEARAIVYVEEILLQEAWRGRGIGLDALPRVIKALKLPKKSIILLEPGPINSAEHKSEGGDGGEKLEKHWKKLNFNAWSYTDPAWLCLSLEDVSWDSDRVLSEKVYGAVTSCDNSLAIAFEPESMLPFSAV